MAAEKEGKRHRVVEAAMRFEIAIPDDLPKENSKLYAEARFKKLCEKINGIKGVSVEYTIR